MRVKATWKEFLNEVMYEELVLNRHLIRIIAIMGAAIFVIAGIRLDVIQAVAGTGLLNHRFFVNAVAVYLIGKLADRKIHEKAEKSQKLALEVF